MGSFEVASLLRAYYPVSKYLIASEEIEPNWGWNYTSIVNSVFNNSSIGGDLLGKEIMQSYVADSKRISHDEKYHADRDITLSVINLEGITQLREKMDELVNSTRNILNETQAFSTLLRTGYLAEHYGQITNWDSRSISTLLPFR